jgi:hypothetical protein
LALAGQRGGPAIAPGGRGSLADILSESLPPLP